MSPTDFDQEQSSVSADIKISARADRRSLEAFYLELRELAAKNGLKVEYRLTLTKPEDQPES